MDRTCGSLLTAALACTVLAGAAQTSGPEAALREPCRAMLLHRASRSLAISPLAIGDDP